MVCNLCLGKGAVARFGDGDVIKCPKCKINEINTKRMKTKQRR